VTRKIDLPGHAVRSADRTSDWPAHGTFISFRSVASRKRMAAARLQDRVRVLLSEADDFDRRAERLRTDTERS
jgi:hypothetical protein